jgi:putative ABC transport system permease protein
MIAPKLARRNILGAGLRTWLNVFVLSLSFVLIIFSQGLIKGMHKQAEEAMIDSEVGGGQYWHPAYDPYDPFNLPDAHGPVPESLQPIIQSGEAITILAAQGTIYPEGRFYTILIKGIDPGQTVLNIPTAVLETPGDEIPLLIGTRMAKTTGLSKGDSVVLQWRDVNGTFDARDAIVVEIMTTSVQTIDASQVWVPLERFRGMMGLPGEATFVVLDKSLASSPPPAAPWLFQTQDDFLADLKAMVRSKSVGSSIIYALLFALAMLAIFDTQILSVFHRRREIGTLISLGFTRARVIRLFTLEGALHGVLAAIVGAIYGIPLLAYLARTGWLLPSESDSYGFAIGEKLFPSYSIGLVLGTTLLVLLTTTIVSYIPTRRIAKLKPTDALRGRMT